MTAPTLRRVLRRLFLPLTLLATSLACSCVGDLMFVNATDAPVELRLVPRADDKGELRRALALAPGASKKAVMSATWQPLDSTLTPHDHVGASANNSGLAVTVPAQSALRLGRVAADCAGGLLGFAGPDSVVASSETRSERIQLTPAAVRARFSVWSRAYYAYEFR